MVMKGMGQQLLTSTEKYWEFGRDEKFYSGINAPSLFRNGKKLSSEGLTLSGTRRRTEQLCEFVPWQNFMTFKT